MPDITLDICVPVYGRGDLLKKCLASIEATAKDIPYRLCIVDDASKDKKEILEALKGVRAIVNWNKQNAGFPTTANKAARMGTAPLIVFVNTDIELTSGCLQAMMEEFKRPEVGVVGAKLLFPETEEFGQYAGTIQHAGCSFGIHATNDHQKIGWRRDHPRANVRVDTLSAVTGALFMTRRNIWEKLGGFDVGYGVGSWEEVEFCTRVRTELAQRIVYQPLAVAYHHVGASAKLDNRGFPLQANRLRFLERCGARIVWDSWLHW